MTKRTAPSHPKSKADWQRWLDDDVKFAVDILVEQGSIAPQFIVHARDGAVFPIVSSLFSQNDKKLMYDFIKLFCLAKDAIAVSSMGEAWMTMMPARPAENLDQAYQRAKKQLPPSLSETRTEQVFVTLVYYDNEGTRQVMSALSEIVRGPDGSPTGTSEIRRTQGDTVGRMIEILPEDRPSWAAVARAKAALAKFKL